METVKRNKRKTKKSTTNVAPLVVTVTTEKKIFSAKQVTPSEIRDLRNPAYTYLA